MVSTAPRETGIVAHRLGMIVIGITMLVAPKTAANAEVRSRMGTNGMVVASDDISDLPGYRADHPAHSEDAPSPSDSSAEKREGRPGGPSAQNDRPQTDKDRQIESLIKALNVSDTAAAAAAELAETGDERAVDPLIKLLYRSKPKWWRGKHAAREALFKIGGTRALKALISVLDDDEISYYVGSSLVKQNDPHVIGLLTATICNDAENPRIIHEAANVLSKMGERGVDPLLSCLQNGNCACSKLNQCAGRRTAAYHLGRMKAARAAGPLIEVLNERFADIYLTDSMHATVSRALSEITDMAFGKDYRAWKKWQAGAGSATQTINKDDERSTVR